MAQLSAFCLCDDITLQEATNVRCTVFNVTDENALIWNSFSTQGSIQELQINVHAEDGRLNYVPSVALRHLPALILFQVHGADIDSLAPYTFSEATQLSQLELKSNKVKALYFIFAFYVTLLPESCFLQDSMCTYVHLFIGPVQ